MFTRPVNDEALTQRLLPACNADRGDRDRAWTEWQRSVGEQVLARYVRAHNTTFEADDDILQDALLTAYLGVERGAYQPRDGVPFTAYVIGIARNKIREARRRDRNRMERFAAPRQRVDGDVEPDALGQRLNGDPQRQPEQKVERREQRKALLGEMARLPDARRQVLEFYLSGASTGEIARRLSISEALVRQHKHRGLQSLLRELEHRIIV